MKRREKDSGPTGHTVGSGSENLEDYHGCSLVVSGNSQAKMETVVGPLGSREVCLCSEIKDRMMCSLFLLERDLWLQKLLTLFS